MSVSLIATGTEHIKLDHRATLTIAAGETVQLEATVELAPDTPDVKRHRPMPALRSLLIIDGQVLELGTGVQPRPAVAVSTAPEHVTLLPGVDKTVHLQLRSYVKQNTTLTVSLAPSPGLATDWTEKQVEIEAKSFAALPVTLNAAQGGVFPLFATVFLPEGKTTPERLAVFALPPGGVLADKGAKESRIENEWTRLVLRPRAGQVRCLSSQSSVGLGDFRERIGPPFWPSELDEKWFDIELQQQDGLVTAVLTAELEAYPEMTLQRKVSLGGGPLVKVEHALLNQGTLTYEVQVNRNVSPWHSEQATLTIPLKDGIVQSRMSEFPAAEEDISKTPDSLSERWAAVTSRWGTFGLIWENQDGQHPPAVENEFGWGVHLPTAKLDCLAQTWTPAGKLYLYVGPGDWKTVRNQARRLAGADEEREPIPIETRKVYRAQLESAGAPGKIPLVALDDEVEAALVIDNLRSRGLQGRATVHLPEPLATVDGTEDASDGVTIELVDVIVDQPLTSPLTLSLPPQADAYQGYVEVQTRLFDTQVPLGVVRLGDRSPVAIAHVGADEAQEHEIDNGRVRFRVAPAFSGAITAWEQAGVNHLLSPYPEQRSFDWMSPWFGGITPVVIKPDSWDMPGKLHHESLTAHKVHVKDDRGIVWKGVRVSGQLAREDFLGLSVEFDYLTVGNSNMLKLVCRAHNRTTAKRKAVLGWLTYWQIDGASTGNTLRSEQLERKHTPWNSWPEADHWGALYNPRTGRTAILVSPYPNVKLVDWGNVGGHLGWFDSVDIAPSSGKDPGIAERVCYVALCESFEQAERYKWLKHYL
jgi:hypothetical protein